MLTSDKVYLFDQNFQSKAPPIDLQIDPAQFKCTRVIPGYDKLQKIQLYLVFCQDLGSATKSFIAIPITISSFTPAVAGKIPLDVITSIGSAEYLDDLLFLNELQEGVVYVLELNFTQLTYKVVEKYLSQDISASAAQLTSFSIWKGEDAQLRKIFLID